MIKLGICICLNIHYSKQLILKFSAIMRIATNTLESYAYVSIWRQRYTYLSRVYLDRVSSCDEVKPNNARRTWTHLHRKMYLISLNSLFSFLSCIIIYRVYFLGFFGTDITYESSNIAINNGSRDWLKTVKRL